jgi:hypothetical protein
MGPPADAESRRLDRDGRAPDVIRRERRRFGPNRETAALLGGLTLIGLSIGGGSLAYPLLRKRGGASRMIPHGGKGIGFADLTGPTSTWNCMVPRRARRSS